MPTVGDLLEQGGLGKMRDNPDSTAEELGIEIDDDLEERDRSGYGYSSSGKNADGNNNGGDFYDV